MPVCRNSQTRTSSSVPLSIWLRAGFGGNWFEQRAEKIEVGSEVWCSDFDYETAIEKPHMEFVVVGKGVRGYRTVALEDVEKYNNHHQVTIFHWKVSLFPTGKKVFVADLSVKKKEEEPIFKAGDRVLCVEGNGDVDGRGDLRGSGRM